MKNHKKNMKKLFIMAQKDILPADFDGWDLKDQGGWSVAHEAARYNRLPPNLPWKTQFITTDRGWTVKNELEVNEFSVDFLWVD